jgi:hypothetical protein
VDPFAVPVIATAARDHVPGFVPSLFPADARTVVKILKVTYLAYRAKKFAALIKKYTVRFACTLVK